MTWPTPYIPRDPDHIIAERIAALEAERLADIRAAAERRAARQALYARLAEQARTRHAAARAALIEDVDWLWPVETPRQIALHLGYSPAALARRLRRAGRTDLALPFERIEAEQKRARARERRVAA